MSTTYWNCLIYNILIFSFLYFNYHVFALICHFFHSVIIKKEKKVYTYRNMNIFLAIVWNRLNRKFLHRCIFCGNNIYWTILENQDWYLRKGEPKLIKSLITDTCDEPCLISACMSGLTWIAHRFVRTTDVADACTVAIYWSAIQMGEPSRTEKRL